MSEADRIKREIARRRKAATDKIRRVKNSSGINLHNTEHDPRLDAKTVNNLSTSGLKDYLSNLNAFTDRATTFQRGARNTILSSNLWHEYKGLESQYNSVGAQHLDAIKDIIVPHTGLTIGEGTEQMLTKRAQGDIVNRPYGLVNREPHNIEGNESLVKLSADLKRKLGRGYLPSTLSTQRDRLKNLFLTMGNPEWDIDNKGMRVEDGDGEDRISAIEFVDRLSDHQFDIFYNYAGGASVAYLHYSVYSMTNARQSAQYEENFVNDISGLFQWASRLPRNRPRASKN